VAVSVGIVVSEPVDQTLRPPMETPR
jgi:hypothetical protein